MQDKKSLERKDILQWAKVSAYTYRACKAKWHYLNINQVCAGNTDSQHKNMCSGDSGGPLTCESRGKVLLVGVMSYGRANDCADPLNMPSVFTKVLKFTKWIQENMDLNNNKPTKPPKVCMWVNCLPSWHFRNWINILKQTGEIN